MVVPKFALEFPFPAVEAPSISDLTETSINVPIRKVMAELSAVNIMWMLMNDDSNLTGNEKLHACWNERLKYPTEKAMKRLALRKVIPRNTSNVVKPPLRTLYTFTIAHKKA